MFYKARKTSSKRSEEEDSREQATAPSPDFKQEDLFVSFIRNQRVCTNKKQLR
jgi:hypothetical protein